MTTPALLLSVAPAFAADKPTAQTQHKPSVAELEKAAAAAKTAYDNAVAAEADTLAALKVLMSDTTPLALAAKAAKAAATDAATAKTEADRAAADAEAAVDGLPETATDAEKAAAATTLAEAEAAAAAAAEAKTAADAKAVEADEAHDDERVGAARALSVAREVTKEALAARTAADEALAEAKEELHGGDYLDTCVSETELTAVITGVPSTVVAGKRVDFTFRVTNGTGKAMDRLFPSVYIRATSRSGHKPLDHLVHLQRWSAATSTWKNVDVEHYMEKISPLKAGAHADVRMRFTIDASAPAGNGATLVSGSYWNADGTCGTTANTRGPDFVIAPAGSKPGKGDDAEPGHAEPGTTGPDTSGLTPQSGTSAGPVDGSLAATGSSSATSQFALAGGAAVAVGAGAMFAVRRRRAGSRV
ncbi:LPXTG cell wall anchor domain-containing protein [Streptomyces sp. NPDC002809]|uniref:LPXTG cell wall anchor domain-containing protein n=1 Tax=Streptomyces sp. NPDC002809 TaxID=3154433 RepID=UPI00331AECFB